MSDMTFLEENQVFGKQKLDIFEKYGPRAAITDFSILLGGYVSLDYYVKYRDRLDDRTGNYWTKTPDGENYVRVIDDCNTD